MFFRTLRKIGCDTGKPIARLHIFEVKLSIYWPSSSFSMFWKLFLHAALFCKQGYLCSIFNMAMLLPEPWKHFRAQVPCFSASFLCYRKWENWLWLLYSFQTLYGLSTGRVKVSLRCQLASVLDLGLLLRNLKFIVYCDRFFLVIVPSDTKLQACQSTQNERRDSNGNEPGLLVGHTSERWLPAASATFAIFRESNQNFSLYEAGCLICSDGTSERMMHYFA